MAHRIQSGPRIVSVKPSPPQSNFVAGTRIEPGISGSGCDCPSGIDRVDLVKAHADPLRPPGTNRRLQGPPRKRSALSLVVDNQACVQRAAYRSRLRWVSIAPLTRQPRSAGLIRSHVGYYDFACGDPGEATLFLLRKIGPTPAQYPGWRWQRHFELASGLGVRVRQVLQAREAH